MFLATTLPAICRTIVKLKNSILNKNDCGELENNPSVAISPVDDET